jgi:tRNA(Ile)-lysidine synthetase-like protein
MVLLDVVRQLPGVRLIVAHVNHGIRKDATEDAKLVEAVSMSHNLVYESAQLSLKEGVNEEIARSQRYDFLRHVRNKYNADAILTAHHRDDLLETAIINMLRGTGWRGLCSLRSTNDILRPFLTVPKQRLVEHAASQGLRWRYDSTNDDLSYLRNYVRHSILAQVPAEIAEKLYAYIVRQNQLATEIDITTDQWIHDNALINQESATLPRYLLIMTPQHVAHELLQQVLRRVRGKSMQRPLAERALLFAKVAKAHKVFLIDSRWQLRALHGQVIVEETPGVVSLDNANGPKGPY